MGIALTLTACPPNTGPTPPPPPSPPAATGYNITLAFGASVPNNIRTVFQSAASRWEQIVTADLPNVGNPVQATDCDNNLTGFPNVSSVDDVIIFAEVKPIDGVGGTLGQAGPCDIRTGSPGLPYIGTMEFDSADLDALAQAGQLQDTITHEMGHVLGYGTLWKLKGLLSGGGAQGACGATPSFTGANAKIEYQTLGGSGNIPVEGSADGSGPGTCDSHWRETTFGAELMTGFLNGGVTNPLSRMSIASMKDLGYTVNLNAADSFSLASVGQITPLSTRTRLNMTLLYPRFKR